MTPPSENRVTSLPPAAVGALQVFSLWTAVVAQPFYNLMVANPEFFAARRAQPLDILTLVAVLGFLLPAGLCLAEYLCQRINFRLSRLLHSAYLAVGFFLIALPSIAFSTREAPWAPVLALAVAALLTWMVWRFEPFSNFVALGALAALVFPLMFLLTPSIRKQMNVFDAPAFPDIKATHSIVILVVDELSTASMVRPDVTIDAEMFPNFARLASTSTWYRRTSTVADSTLMAVPAMLSGVQPNPDSLPFFGDHPRNLFTLLAKNYDFHISESRTNLCPPSRTEDSQAWTDHISSLLHDELLMIAHGTLPARWKQLLPDVRFDFSDFGSSADGKAGFQGKAERFLEFVNAIVKKPEPQLIFLHTILPHSPWRYLPDGQRYADGDAGFLGMPVYELWNDSSYLVEQNFQRHMFQATFVDRLLGDLLDKLEKEDLFEDSLVIVVADHGLNFVPGKSRRFVDQTNYAPILSVPLFIKLPGQNQAKIDDRPVQLTDLMPSLVDFLDLELGWSFDGVSFLTGDYQPRKRNVVNYFGERYEYPAGEDLLAAALKLKPKLFPPGSTAQDLYAFGPDLQLLGSQAPPGTAAGNVEWTKPEQYLAVDPDSGFCPSWIRGSVAGLKLDVPLAVAVNGTIAATGRSYRHTPEKVGFTLFVPPAAFRAGSNQLTLYQIREDGSLEALGRTP